MADITLTDPLGRAISFPDSTWYGHILVAHPELRPTRHLAEQAVQNPTEIRHSQKDVRCRLYYGVGPRERVMMTVVVDLPLRLVKTAYLSDRPKGGKIEWQP